MAAKDRIVFEFPPAEKAWIDALAQAVGYDSKIQMFRALLDAESARVGYVARPGALPGGKTDIVPILTCAGGGMPDGKSAAWGWCS